MPKRLASPIRVWEPFGLRVPPMILQAIDQWAHTALRQIVVGWDARDRDKDKEFGQKAFHAFTSGVLRRKGPHVGLAQVPELLLEGMVLCHASQALFVR
ncbi:MAG TPA: hypothetical protein VF026_15270 [Ktedonobacteraceae bacterium]